MYRFMVTSQMFCWDRSCNSLCRDGANDGVVMLRFAFRVPEHDGELRQRVSSMAAAASEPAWCKRREPAPWVR
jgi:hypothetical protein